MSKNTEKFLKLSIFLFVGLFFLFSLPESAFAQCAGWTRCGASLPEGGCDPDHDYIIGCGNGCSSGGCGGCEISSSCSGGPAPVCECGTRADGSCKPCSGGNQCNADYIRNCPSGIKTQQVTGSQCVSITAACKDGSGNVAVGSAQGLGDCCGEKCVPNPPFEDECWCNKTTVLTYTCCPVGTEPNCYQGNPTYSYVYKNVTEDMGAPALSSFNAQCSPGKPISMELYATYKCDRTGAPKPDGTKTCYTYRARCRYPGITLCDCVPVCNAKAPTEINYDALNNDLKWKTGINGTSQKIYVSTKQSEVNSNCGSGTNCMVNDSVASNIDFYLLPTLQPDTNYFVKLVNYKDANCSASTNYNFKTPVLDDSWWQVKDGDVPMNYLT